MESEGDYRGWGRFPNADPSKTYLSIGMEINPQSKYVAFSTLNGDFVVLSTASLDKMILL